ncbi:MAG: AlkZ family DNA glycosylase [Chitinophagaceae bacterium]|nr:AlkZ family DNA glycosylase [Chitinophagaceae bacterium]
MKSVIPFLRLISQRLVASNLQTPAETVTWMGAVQAQDYPMAKWGVGVRTTGATENSVQNAIDKGSILRTHVLRPTWHLVSSNDIHWMLQLTSKRIKATMNWMNRELNLTPEIFKKSNRLLAKILDGDNHLTRPEIIAAYKKSRIAVDENRLSHLLGWAELDGIICSGANAGKKTTYALLSGRTNPRKPISDDQALLRLTEQYFKSHGPATAADFTWWSGLTLTLAKQGIEMAGKKLVSEIIDGKEYLMEPSLKDPQIEKGVVHLLPSYDEYLVAYKDRSALIPATITKQIISFNGIFRPVILVDGKVAGVWARSFDGNTVVLELKFFGNVSRKVRTNLAHKAEQYGKFIASPVITKFLV